MDNHAERHDSPRSCRDALSKKCYRIHKSGQNKNKDIRQELEISGIQDVRLKYKQNWSTTSKAWTTPNSQNISSPTNSEEEGIVDAPGNDGNASMPEQVKWPNPWRKMMMMIMMFSNMLDIKFVLGLSTMRNIQIKSHVTNLNYQSFMLVTTLL